MHSFIIDKFASGKFLHIFSFITMRFDNTKVRTHFSKRPDWSSWFGSCFTPADFCWYGTAPEKGARFWQKYENQSNFTHQRRLQFPLHMSRKQNSFYFPWLPFLGLFTVRTFLILSGVPINLLLEAFSKKLSKLKYQLWSCRFYSVDIHITTLLSQNI